MSYSTDNSTYHIQLCSITTDKVLVDKQEEIEILQEKITPLTLQLMEREEKISQLMENMKGKQLLDILLYQIHLYSNSIVSVPPSMNEVLQVRAVSLYYLMAKKCGLMMKLVAIISVLQYYWLILL